MKKTIIATILSLVSGSSGVLMALAIASVPTTARAGCGSSDCTGTGRYTAVCCVDAFNGCRRYERRPCPQGYEYHFLSTETGTCENNICVPL